MTDNNEIYQNAETTTTTTQQTPKVDETTQKTKTWSTRLRDTYDAQTSYVSVDDLNINDIRNIPYEIAKYSNIKDILNTRNPLTYITQLAGSTNVTGDYNSDTTALMPLARDCMLIRDVDVVEGEGDGVNIVTDVVNQYFPSGVDIDDLAMENTDVTDVYVRESDVVKREYTATAKVASSMNVFSDTDLLNSASALRTNVRNYNPTTLAMLSNATQNERSDHMARLWFNFYNFLNLRYYGIHDWAGDYCIGTEFPERVGGTPDKIACVVESEDESMVHAVRATLGTYLDYTQHRTDYNIQDGYTEVMIPYSPTGTTNITLWLCMNMFLSDFIVFVDADNVQLRNGVVNTACSGQLRRTALNSVARQDRPFPDGFVGADLPGKKLRYIFVNVDDLSLGSCAIVSGEFVEVPDLWPARHAGIQAVNYMVTTDIERALNAMTDLDIWVQYNNVRQYANDTRSQSLGLWTAMQVGTRWWTNYTKYLDNNNASRVVCNAVSGLGGDGTTRSQDDNEHRNTCETSISHHFVGDTVLFDIPSWSGAQTAAYMTGCVETIIDGMIPVASSAFNPEVYKMQLLRSVTISTWKIDVAIQRLGYADGIFVSFGSGILYDTLFSALCPYNVKSNSITEAEYGAGFYHSNAFSPDGTNFRSVDTIVDLRYTSRTPLVLFSSDELTMSGSSYVDKAFDTYELHTIDGDMTIFGERKEVITVKPEKVDGHFKIAKWVLSMGRNLSTWRRVGTTMIQFNTVYNTNSPLTIKSRMRQVNVGEYQGVLEWNWLGTDDMSQACYFWATMPFLKTGSGYEVAHTATSMQNRYIGVMARGMSYIPQSKVLNVKLENTGQPNMLFDGLKFLKN